MTPTSLAMCSTLDADREVAEATAAFGVLLTVFLGLSQFELADRAGMTQPALSRLEAGGVIPTMLERISAALDADLIVAISPHAA